MVVLGTSVPKILDWEEILNKPLRSGRDIFEVANQLGGYVDPKTPDDLAKFLLRESEAANELAEEVVLLREIVEISRKALLGSWELYHQNSGEMYGPYHPSHKVGKALFLINDPEILREQLK